MKHVTSRGAFGWLLGIQVVMALTPALSHAALVRLAASSDSLGYGADLALGIDATGDYVYSASSAPYVVSGTSSTIVRKTRLSDMTVTARAVLNSTQPATMVTDSGSGYALVVSSDAAAAIEKVSLGAWTEVSSTTLASLGRISTGFVDGTNGYAYFGSTGTSPVVTKVRISDLAFISSVTLPSGTGPLSASAVDVSNGFGYFASSTTPAQVTQVKLSNLQVTSSITINSGEGRAGAMVLDSSLGYAWIGTDDIPAKIVRLRLSPLARLDSLTLNAGEGPITAAVYDSSVHLGYMGLDTSTGIVVRANLLSMRRDSALTLATGEPGLRSAAIDTTNQYGYFSAWISSGAIIKVDLIGGAPELTSSPATEVTVGFQQSVTLSVTARGRSVAYQWNRNGSALSGATAASYTISNADFSEDGMSYSCTVSNSSGSVTTAGTRITVQPDVHVYPNPWRVDRHGGTDIHFSGLPPGSEVRIFTLAAQWVRSLPEASGSVSWNLRNDAGQNVASGYYFYVVRTPNDRQNLKGKLAIIR